MNHNIFITGGTGYIGRRLITKLLKRGHTVQALVRASSEYKIPSGCIKMIGDALDKASYSSRIQDTDTFIHLIGVPHPNPSKEKLFRDVDLVSIQAAVAAAKEAQIRHFIYLSVAQPLPSMNRYVEVRQEGERLIHQSRLNATIIRPFYILGPGHWWPYLVMPLFWLTRNFYHHGQYRESMKFVTLEQMIHTLLTAVENPANGIRIFNPSDIH